MMDIVLLQHVSAGSYDVKGAILVIVEKEILE